MLGSFKSRLQSFFLVQAGAAICFVYGSLTTIKIKEIGNAYLGKQSWQSNGNRNHITKKEQ